MVGVGGGVPSQHADIRLGDVVVSKPTAVSSGVIQYDYGKTLRDGQFQRTGSLNKPPPMLLKAVAQLESDLKSGEGRLNTGILGALQNNELKEEFSRPTADWLFKSTYNHKNGASNCSTCDKSKLVQRPSRATEEPYIHYGLIASGDQVIKDARARDTIAQELDILCFEMEAAGLMDELPSIVIRGISDYCDTHKHKSWQGYAALSAAAYAKLLLSVVPPTVNKASTQNITFTAEEKECLRGLFLTDPADDKNALKRRKGDRAPGTCSWILETPELKSWLGNHNDGARDEPNILWLYGNPGTGKSTVVITMTDELPKQPCFVHGQKILAYFFCDSSSEVNRTATSVLRGLLYQLVKQRPTLMQPLLSRYTEHGDKLFSSFDALWAVLIEIDTNCRNLQIYCIIDALDECEPDSQMILLDQINQTFNRLSSRRPCQSTPHFLITSRPYHEIRRSLDTFLCRDLTTYEAVANDLRTVIQQRVEILSERNRYPKTVIVEVSRTLEEKAEGTFLWVGIACEELAQVQSRNAINSLQALPRGLDSLYHKLLNAAVAASNEHDEQIIIEILSLVAFAVRPLTLSEISEACNLYPDDDEDCRLQFTRECIDLCRLMIVVQGLHVRLLHQSVKDFLVKAIPKIDSLKANATMAYKCINNILRAHELGILGKRRTDPHRGFLEYSVLYWPEHASRSGTNFTVLPDHERFFLPKSPVWARWRLHYNFLQRVRLQSFRTEHLYVGFSTLYAAARWGIPQLIHFAVDGPNAGCDIAQTADPEALIFVDTNGSRFTMTPLAEAAIYGRIDMMRILIKIKPPTQLIHADVMRAAVRSDVHGDQTVSFLLDHFNDQIKITPEIIRVAARNRLHREGIISLLLKRCKRQFQDSAPLISAVMKSCFDETFLAFFLGQWKSQIKITEDIIRDLGLRRPSVRYLRLLLEQFKDQIQGNAQLISAVIQSFPTRIVAVFLQCCGEGIQITEDIFKAAARNYGNGNVMSLVLESYDNQLQIANLAEDKAWQARGAETRRYWRGINREAGERYWYVPPFSRPRDFTPGDPEITKLERLITQEARPARIAVCGGNELDNRPFLLELAYRAQERDFTDSTFWVLGITHELLEEAFTDIANMLGFCDSESAKAKDRAKDYLSQRKAGRWLLIVDCVDEDLWTKYSADSPPLTDLTDLLPQSEQGCIIFSTKHEELAAKLTSTEVIFLPPSKERPYGNPLWTCCDI